MGKNGQMDCDQPQTIVKLAESLLDAYRRVEAQSGKPLGAHARNAIAKRLVRISRANLGTPVVLTTRFDLRALP